MILVDKLAVAFPLSVFPRPHVFRASLLVIVSALLRKNIVTFSITIIIKIIVCQIYANLPLPKVTLPLALVVVTVHISILPPAVPLVVSPLALIFAAIRIDKRASAVLLIFEVLPGITSSIFKSNKK